MGATRVLTDKPITKETIRDSEGNVIAVHTTDVITDPNAANAVRGEDPLDFPSADGSRRNPLNVQDDDTPAHAFDADVADVNEVQTLAKTGTVSGGTYTLTFNGHTTAAIAVSAVAADVKAALVALEDFESSDLTVTGGPVSSTPVVITFVGDYAGRDVSAITVDGALATGGGTLAVTETTKGIASDSA